MKKTLLLVAILSVLSASLVSSIACEQTGSQYYPGLGLDEIESSYETGGYVCYDGLPEQQGACENGVSYVGIGCDGGGCLINYFACPELE